MRQNAKVMTAFEQGKAVSIRICNLCSLADPVHFNFVEIASERAERDRGRP